MRTRHLKVVVVSLLAMSVLACGVLIYLVCVLPKQVRLWEGTGTPLSPVLVVAIQFGNACRRFGPLLVPLCLAVPAALLWWLVVRAERGQQHPAGAIDWFHSLRTQTADGGRADHGTAGRFVAQWCLIGAALLCIFLGPLFLPGSGRVVEIGPIREHLDDLLRVLVPLVVTSVSLLMGLGAFRDVAPESDAYPVHIISNVTYVSTLVVWSWMVGCITDLGINDLAAGLAVAATYIILYIAPKVVLSLRRCGKTPLLADAFLCAVCGTLLVSILPSSHGMDYSAGLALSLLLKPWYWVLFLLPASLAIAAAMLPFNRNRREHWVVFVVMQPPVCIAAMACSGIVG